MTAAKESLSRLYETLSRLQEAAQGSGSVAIDFGVLLEKGMDDDFNTTVTIGEIFRHVRQINSLLDKGQGWNPENKRDIFRGIRETVGGILGVFHSDPAKYLERQKQIGLRSAVISEDEIKKLIEDRKTARQGRDFQRADAIRNELASQGVQIKDSPDGDTTWEIKK